jgi:hypothetical protein
MWLSELVESREVIKKSILELESVYKIINPRSIDLG